MEISSRSTSRVTTADILLNTILFATSGTARHREAGSPIVERKEKDEDRHPVGTPGTFNRESNITWDSHDDMYVSDGYGNSRLVKIRKDGTWVGSVGTYGSGPDHFNTPHAITSDAKDNIYVGDRGNNRIQVYNTDLKLQKTITGMGAPWAVCVSPATAAAPRVLYSGDGGNGRIYKFDLDGKLLGWAQTSLGHGSSSCLIHEIHCKSDKVIYKGDCSTWTVEKITIK